MDKLICIVGPTGVGKTKLSIELAKKYHGEVINADSTQVYKGLDIATAKVTKEEMEGVVHHLLDIKDLDEMYTVYDFKRDALEKIEEIKKRGHTPILVGGTGLYVTALLYDYDLSLEEKEPILVDNLYEEVLKLDPNTTIHPNNKKRLKRFLEYYAATGKLLSEKEMSHDMKMDAYVIGLTTSRDILYDRINRRVDKMLEDGLLKEAKDLYDRNITTKAVMTPIGYKELFPYFEGKITLEEAILDMKQKSRHYAKRQYTWFKNKMDVTWFDVNFDDFSFTVLEVCQYIDSNL
jgi:tRNA dimethylallyltransferase